MSVLNKEDDFWWSIVAQHDPLLFISTGRPWDGFFDIFSVFLRLLRLCWHSFLKYCWHLLHLVLGWTVLVYLFRCMVLLHITQSRLCVIFWLWAKVQCEFLPETLIICCLCTKNIKRNWKNHKKTPKLSGANKTKYIIMIVLTLACALFGMLHVGAYKALNIASFPVMLLCDLRKIILFLTVNMQFCVQK